MGSNTFGNLFRITTFGESHGPLIGVVIDGCPSGLRLDEAKIQAALDKRRPGTSAYVSSREETDQAEIVSGVFEGVTTGAPIAILIRNHQADSSAYDSVKAIFRPGHANFTYLQKYGVLDDRGGGRASARETACRVAAGAVAAQLLEAQGVQAVAYLQQVGRVVAKISSHRVLALRQQIQSHELPCPDGQAASQMMLAIQEAKQQGDSVGGLVGFVVEGCPPGWGDPVYEKLDATLAQAMISIPGAKGFDLGSGFACVSAKGSEHNDAFATGAEQHVVTITNHAGGVLGGISTGMPIVGRVAFKPTPSILQPQTSVNLAGETVTFQLPSHAKHDPCIAVRAVPVVEAMCYLVLADACLMQKARAQCHVNRS